MSELTAVEKYVEYKRWQYLPANASGEITIKPTLCCFIEGTSVFTEKGIEAIEGIPVGRCVLTRSGTLRPVVKIWRREIIRECLVEFFAFGMSRPIVCTREHPIFCAEEMKGAHIGNVLTEKYSNCVDCRTHASWYTAVTPALALCSNRMCANSLWVELPNLVPTHSDIIPDAYFLGLFCAEGIINNKVVTFCLGAHETLLINKIKCRYPTSRVYFSKVSAGVAVCLGRIAETPPFLDCGRGAANKKVPFSILLTSHEDTIRQFIQGLQDGDGHTRENGLHTITTISEQMAIGVAILLRRLGLSASITHTPAKVGKDRIKRREAYLVTYRDKSTRRHPTIRFIDGKWYGKVSWARTKAGKYYSKGVPVYNLTVEEDHSYIANGAVVKNCGNTKFHHFYINRDTGKWFCQHCRRKGGSLNALKRLAGDFVPDDLVAQEPAYAELEPVDPAKVERLHQTLIADELEALQWLSLRGVKLDTIKRFKLGATRLPSDYSPNDLWVCFPYFRGTDCIAIKSRLLRPKKDFRWEPAGVEHPLYNQASLNGSGEVNIAEGETDTVILHQAGFPNVVGLPDGAGTFSANHWETIADRERINLFLDPDVPGYKGAKEIATRLGPDRCYLVPLPLGQDVNEFLMRGNSIDELKLRVQRAKPFGRPAVVDLFTATAEILEDWDDQSVGYDTPWRGVNRLLKSIRDGETLALVAAPKVGKTSFCLNWLSYLVFKKKVPALFYTLDMSLNRVVPMIAASELYWNSREITTSTLRWAMSRFWKHPFHIIDESGSIPDLDRILHNIEMARRRFGVKVVCFDHVHKLVYGAKDPSAKLAEVAMKFTALARRLHYAQILIVQPRKSAYNQIAESEDMAGSGGCPAEVDHIASLFRKRKASQPMPTAAEMVDSDGSFESKGLFNLSASRYNDGGKAVLWMHGECNLWTESDTAPIVGGFSRFGAVEVASSEGFLEDKSTQETTGTEVREFQV